MSDIALRPIAPGEAAFCERVLRALPDWFGIEESLVQYVRDTATYPTWIVESDGAHAGFITIHEHNPLAAEIHCMGLLPECHRRGIGRAMVQLVEDDLRKRGLRFLQVKTMGPSRPCEFYDLTRRFYEAVGFVPLEEFPKLWPGNPCLLLVKKLD